MSDREIPSFQSGWTRPELGWVASGRGKAGLKYAGKQKGPASGTLRQQKAGLGDGSGTPLPAAARIKGGYAHTCVTDEKSVPTWSEQRSLSFQPGEGAK